MLGFGLLDCYFVLFGPIILVGFGLIYLLNLVLGLTPFAYIMVFLFVVVESGKRGAVLIGSSWGR